MRVIKFRAWDEKRKWMYKTANIWFSENTNKAIPFSHIQQEEDTPIFDCLYNENAILMQFTGLLDKNGTEIYEGDVIQQGIKEIDCWFAPRVVEFKNGAWMGGRIRIFVEQDKCDYQGRVSNDEWEIIGNIYENPELLD